MRQTFILITIMLLITYNIQAQNIGINTLTPQALLHFDGKNNTSGNNNIEDDVIINSEGKLGIGTLSPTAKLHIETFKNNPLNLQDGSEGPLKMLQSDADGNASWISRLGVMLKANVNFASTTTIPSVLTTGSYESGILMKTNIPLIAPETGNYMLILRWWGWRQTTSLNYNSGYIRLFINNETIHRDAVEHYFPGESNNYFCFCVVLYASVFKGDTFKLTVLATNGPDWSIAGTTSKAILRPSILLIKI